MAVVAVIGPDLGRLGQRAAGDAARRAAQALDAQAAAERARQAAGGAPGDAASRGGRDAYLTIFGALVEAAGALAAVDAYTARVTAGQATEAADGRCHGQVMADHALGCLSRRAVGEPQAVEVQLVMTDTSLFGHGPGRAGSPDEPAHLPGHGADAGRRRPRHRRRRRARRGVGPRSGCGGCSPAPTAGTWSAWTPVAGSSPAGCGRWCGCMTTGAAPPGARPRPGPLTTSRSTPTAVPRPSATGPGCACAATWSRTSPGWRAEVVHHGTGGPHVTRTTTPTGHTFDAVAPPILGWGWSPPPAFDDPLDVELAALIPRMQSVDDAWIDGMDEIEVVGVVDGNGPVGTLGGGHASQTFTGVTGGAEADRAEAAGWLAAQLDPPDTCAA